MAQALGRKTMVSRENVSRPPVAVKAFGDTAGKQTRTRNKSSTKIPKTLRHDLENALVNLCDIWFEEIKPHLIRNNIKLHVHDEQAGGEGAKYLPPGAPGCSHLDPGAASDHHQGRNASFADCCSPQRTTSRARCRRPPPRPTTPLRPNSPISQRRHASCADCCSPQRIILKAQSRRPPPRPTTPPRLNPSPISLNKSPKRSEGIKRKPRKRKHIRKQTQSEGRLRVPRLCQNLGFSSPLPTSSRGKRKSGNQSEFIKSIHIRSKTRDQTTQTDNSSKYLNSPSYAIPKSSDFPENRRIVSFVQNSQRKKEKVQPLFQKDLINIICSENDKRLKVLYKRPPRSNISSIMNLTPDLEVHAKKCKKKERPRPWK